MKTRIGKIARLPANIREEINHRLSQGALAKDLIAWLNALPEVQKIMTKLFGGTKVTHQNISVWRHGGYADWAENHSDRSQWHGLLDHIEELSRIRTLPDGTDVTSHLTTLVVYELSLALDQLGRMENSEERWRIFRQISRSLSRLRMDDCREKRIRLWDRKTGSGSNQFKPIPIRAAH